MAGLISPKFTTLFIQYLKRNCESEKKQFIYKLVDYIFIMTLALPPRHMKM